MANADWWNPSTDEYEYTVAVKATETFKNTLSKQGVDLPAVTSITKFSSSKLLDMKALKQRGLIGSYTIVRVMTVRQLVETG